MSAMEFNSNFTYQLPFGRGRGNSWQLDGARLEDEAVGGWEQSPVNCPHYRDRVAIQSASADAYLASFDNLDNAIFTGTTKADLPRRQSTLTTPARLSTLHWYWRRWCSKGAR